MPMIFARPILPRKFENVFLRQIAAEYKKVAESIQFDLEQATASWEHQPKWERSVEILSDKIVVAVTTDDPAFQYVDLGTKAHDIEGKVTAANPTGRLAFMTTGFKAKSSPSSLSSSYGSPAGPPLARPAVVHHPGIKARNFTKKIRQAWQKKIRARVDPFIKRAAKESGHGVR